MRATKCPDKTAIERMSARRGLGRGRLEIAASEERESPPGAAVVAAGIAI